MSGMAWFRMYAEFATDPDVQSLAFEDQRHYVILLCLKCNGTLDKDYPTADRRYAVIRRTLGLDSVAIDECKRRLIEAGLIDHHWQPLGWSKRQYLSDSSYERVKRHRAKRSAAGLSQQNWIAPDIRTRVFERDGNRCLSCQATDDLTIDHIVSELNGGTNEVENLQTLCRVCNASKRDHDNEAFQKRFINAPRIQRQITETEAEKKTEARKARPASRLPEDFSLTQERRAIAEAEKLDPERVFADFCDYWRALAGAKARKLDWDATWRVWCRNQFSKAPKRGGYQEPVITWRPPPDEDQTNAI